MCAHLDLHSSKTSWTRTHDESDVNCVKFSTDGKSLAIGCFNGNVYIRDVIESRLMNCIKVSQRDSPVTTIRWHPKIPNTIIVANAKGIVSSWYTGSGQRLWQFGESENSVNCLDICPNGSTFTTVGSDQIVRVYDLQTRKLMNTMSTLLYCKGIVSGHENRVFACHYIDQNVVASSGWDDTCILWDLRSGSVVRSIGGVHVCGDSVQHVNNILITGSWRCRKQLQFWDILSGGNIDSVSIGSKSNALFIYGVSLTHDKSHVGVCGSELNQAQFYETKNYVKAGSTEEFSNNILSIDFSKSDTLAIGLSDSSVYVDHYKLNTKIF